MINLPIENTGLYSVIKKDYPGFFESLDWKERLFFPSLMSQCNNAVPEGINALALKENELLIDVYLNSIMNQVIEMTGSACAGKESALSIRRDLDNASSQNERITIIVEAMDEIGILSRFIEKKKAEG